MAGLTTVRGRTRLALRDPSSDVAAPSAVSRGDGTSPIPRMHILLMLAVCLLVVVIAALGQKRIGVFDEATHVDYAYQVAHLHLPRAGDTLAPLVLEEWSCRGPIDPGLPLPACGEPYDVSEYPAAGLQYNYWNTPLYYVVTGPIARLVVAVTPVDSFITAARLVSVGWIFAGMLVLSIALRELGVSSTVTLTATIFAAAVPATVQAGAAVSNDSPSLLVGALALLWVARASRGRWGISHVAVIVAFAMLLKATGLAVAILIVVVCVYCAVTKVGSWSQARALGAGAVALAVGLGTLVAWTALQEIRATAGYLNPTLGVNTYAVDGFPIEHILATALSLIPPSGIAHLFERPLGVFWSSSLRIMLGAAPVAAFLVARARGRARALAVASVVSLVGMSMAVQLSSWVSEGYVFRSPSSRYGMAVLPAVVVCLALAVDDSRVARRLFGGWTASGVCIVGVLLFAQI